MKRILRIFIDILFWRRNPKAGAVFGAWMSTLFLLAWPVFASWLGGRDDHLAPFSPGALVFFGYGVLLQVVFIARGLPETIRRGQVYVLVFFLEAAVLAMCCAVIYILNVQWHFVFAILCMLASAAWMAALNAMPPGSYGKGIWLVPAFVAFVLVVPEILIKGTDMKVAATFRWHSHAFATNVPVLSLNAERMTWAAEQYLVLTNPVHDIGYTRYENKTPDPLQRPLPEEEAWFDASLATNANAIAFIDQLVDGDTGFVRVEAVAPWNTTPYLDTLVSYARVIRDRMCFAVWNNDPETLLEGNRRLEKIEAIFRVSSNQAERNGFVYSIEAGRRRLLMAGLHMLPGDRLATLQKDFTDNLPSVDDVKINALCKFANWFAYTRRGNLSRLGRKHAKAMAYMFPWAFCIQRGELVEGIKSIESGFTLLDTASLGEPERYQLLFERYDKASGCRCSSNLHIILEQEYFDWISNIEHRRLAAAAVAVERHRRCHGVLPASLEDLVPEFIGAVPVSLATGEPFTFEHGTVETTGDDDPEKQNFINGFSIKGGMMITSPYTNKRQSAIHVPLGNDAVPGG